MPGSALTDQPWWSTFASWPVPTAVLSADGRPVWLNDAFCTLLGRSADQVVAEGVLTTPQYADAEPELRAALLAGERSSYRVRKQVVGPAGRSVSGDLTVALMHPADGSPDHLVAHFLEADHTEQPSEREQLFLQSLSHELRTPLTSIVGPVELLLDRSDLPADVVRQLDTVRRNAERLTRQVVELMDVAQMEEGRLTLREGEFDLAALARSVIDTASADPAAAGIAIAYDGPARLPVRGDRERLRQALDHLVGNAVKFTDPGGRIRVRARAEGTDVHLAVEDTGVGLAPGELAIVFGRFVRGTAADRRASRGTGVGLWVARCVVQAHGGRIDIERTGPDGTIVCVDLPGRVVERAEHGPVFMHSPDVAWVDTGDAVTALELSDGSRPQALQGVAAVIWRVLGEPQSLESLLDALAVDFPDTDRAQMRGDVEAFLDQLAAARLVATLED